MRMSICLIWRNERDRVRAYVVERHDCIEALLPADEPVREPLQQPVAPCADARHAHEDEDDGDRADRDEEAEIIDAYLTKLEG